MKRLRKSYEKPIRYFACGEYGDEKERPHYHAILYGIGINKEDREYIKRAWPYCDWKNPRIAKNAFGIVEHDSCRYVAGYIMKKIDGEMELNMRLFEHREPPFRLLSQGLGKNWCIENKDRLTQDGFISIKGVKTGIPRYYLKKNGIDVKTISNLVEHAYEKECETVEKKCGIYATEEQLYKNAKTEDYRRYDEEMRKSKAQNEANIKAKNTLYKKTL